MEQLLKLVEGAARRSWQRINIIEELKDHKKSLRLYGGCLLYTSDAADE